MTGSALFNAGPGSRPRRELVPGAVHMPSWLTTGQQQGSDVRARRPSLLPSGRTARPAG
jgi:hypothetical protein